MVFHERPAQRHRGIGMLVTENDDELGMPVGRPLWIALLQDAPEFRWNRDPALSIDFLEELTCEPLSQFPVDPFASSHPQTASCETR